MSKFETFGEKQKYQIVSVSFNAGQEEPTPDEHLAAILRVRSLYERICQATSKGCSDDLEEFLADLSIALDGEQE